MVGQSLHRNVMKAEASKAATVAGCLLILNRRDMKSVDAASKHLAQEDVFTAIFLQTIIIMETSELRYTERQSRQEMSAGSRPVVAGIDGSPVTLSLTSHVH